MRSTPPQPGGNLHWVFTGAQLVFTAGTALLRSTRARPNLSIILQRMLLPMSRVEIYTTAICPYCVAAKNFLKGRGFDYSETRVDREPGKMAEMLQRSDGRRSVPQIFVNGVHVGGYDDLVAADRSGKLRELTEESR